MNVITRLVTSLARRLRCEQAIAMPVAVMILSVMALLGVAAAASAISATRVSGRDRSSARALAAADAGIDATRGRLNAHVAGIEKDYCVFLEDGKVAYRGPFVGGVPPVTLPEFAWCAPANTDSLDDGGQHTWAERDVVSTGSTGGVDRRVLSTIRTPLLTEWFARYTVIGIDGIDMYDESTIETGGVPITDPVTGEDVMRGAVSKEYIKLWGGADLNHTADLPVGESVFKENPPDGTDPDNERGSFPDFDREVTLPSPWLKTDRDDLMEVEETPGEDPPTWVDSWTNNDNGPYELNLRPLENPGPSPSPCVRTTGTGTIICDWDPVTRRLEMWGGVNDQISLNFTYGAFSFCDIDITGNAAIMISRLEGDPPAKFLIDSPDQCQLEAEEAGCTSDCRPDGNYEITINTPTPVPDHVPANQFIVAGSDNSTTTLKISGSGINHATIYAPQTAVTLDGFNLKGAVAGKTVVLKGTGACFTTLCSSSVTTHEGIPDVQYAATKLFASRSWAECTAVPTGSAPDSGC